MDIELDFIQFQGQLFNAVNKPVKELPVAIQFYNTNIHSWITLTSLMVKEGKLSQGLEIPDRISTSNQTIRAVREVLRSGGVPSFRLIKVTKETSQPLVIASDFNVQIDKNKGVLILNFGRHWLLTDAFVTNVKTHAIIASPIPLFKANAIINTLESEKDTLTASNKNLDKQITNLNDKTAILEEEKENLMNEMNEVKNETKEKEILFIELNNNVTQLNSDLSKEIESKQSLIDAITVSEGQNLELKNRIKELEAEGNVMLEEKIVQLEDLLKEKQREKEELIEEREAFLFNITKLQNDIRDHNKLLTAKNTELERKQTLITGLEQNIQKLTKELEEVKAFNKTDHPNKLSASKVYGSIVNDVIKADEELLNSKFKLANVSLNLKTTVEKGPEGTMLGLLDFETAKGINGAAISDISIDIVPNQNSVTTVGEKMPNVLGLTETATRKKLSEYGLKLDAIYHPTNDANLIEGQSFKQSPAPEANIVEGQEVVVIFAKPLN
ncbi:PASTA domain-containing protein [Tenacibaculum jejuense]|uniref:PASTA domain-containing protein n=1 Tax=Tenacibaculum jejuense TaxID=584609 RepID=A0A238U6V0_9FLAO|nr:PASTA domain-containing protein [Tenacibaculum jejuense]SNR14110.1 protein of unknown function [Tenacibaculum jejuense]